MWAEITEPSSEKSKVYLSKNLPPYLSFSQQCLLLEERPREDLLQGWWGSLSMPHLQGGQLSTHPLITLSPWGIYVMCWAVPFHGWEAPNTVLLWRTEPRGALRGADQDPLHLWASATDWNLCLHKSKSLWLLARTNKSVHGLQNRPTYLWLADFKILIRNEWCLLQWCMKWYCFRGPWLWSQTYTHVKVILISASFLV